MKIISELIITIVIILIILVFSAIGYIVYTEIIVTNKNPEISIQNFRTELEGYVDWNKEEVKSNTKTQTDSKDLKGLESSNNKSSSSQKNEIKKEKEVSSSTNINKFFYNQLDKYSKKIYQGFYTNKENMKTGTYTIEFGDYFTEVLNKENGSNILGQYYQTAIESYIYDNVDVFYLDPQKMTINMEEITKGKKVTYNVYINSGDRPNYLEDEFNSKQAVDSALSSIEKSANMILADKKNNTYDNIKMVHDYLINNIEYDIELSKPYIYNIYGAMVKKVSVCEGYAESFKYLMDKLNIPCTLVIGVATNSNSQAENHAWNYVKIDNKWYAIDVTWDDPISTTGFVSNKSKYKYFLKGSDYMSKDHEVKNQFSEDGKIFQYPNISTTNYDT